MGGRRRRNFWALLALGALTLAAPPRVQAQVGEEKQFVLDWLGRDAQAERFGKISDAVWSFAELGLEEFKSSAMLMETLEAEGFSVEKGLAGMPTCFTARYGSGHPVIGILVEYDALPMLSQKAGAGTADPVVPGAPGHGCGHNRMAGAATAAAIAVKEAIAKFDLEGTVILFGSPAEEMLVSRPYMIRAGLFDGVDAVINNHASTAFSTAYGQTGSAMISVIYRFTGKTAHSGASPWAGRSALDAVEIMDVATNYLREHLHYSTRMHYIVLDGGEAPNVVPDRASVWYFLRGSDERLPETFERVRACAEGAALATGTKMSEERVLAAAHQQFHNKHLAEMMQENIELVGMPAWSEEDQQAAKELQRGIGAKESGMPEKVGGMGKPDAVFTGGASSDHGDVTLIAPTVTVRFPGGVPGTAGHHWTTVACGHGPAAWKGLIAGAKAMAATAVDLFTSPEDLRAAREEFAELAKERPYKPFLPEDAQPPLDINEELMQLYRPLMEPFYEEE